MLEVIILSSDQPAANNTEKIVKLIKYSTKIQFILSMVFVTIFVYRIDKSDFLKSCCLDQKTEKQFIKAFIKMGAPRDIAKTLAKFIINLL
ncbi:hypothetical protein TW93_17255 [Bacillus pumilus]|uniref:hypothetical protein n=1 Tax=Bacillus pumilus TaxID=1408 RepID=UPI000680A0EA|nr:hypothetical protein TW93_17255 [Bacillus pumilus]PRS60127.1 hypothetical protein C6X97_15090 [Bacillus pumilus]